MPLQIQMPFPPSGIQRSVFLIKFNWKMTEPWSLINRKFPTKRTCRTEGVAKGSEDMTQLLQSEHWWKAGLAWTTSKTSHETSDTWRIGSSALHSEPTQLAWQQWVRGQTDWDREGTWRDVKEEHSCTNKEPAVKVLKSIPRPTPLSGILCATMRSPSALAGAWGNLETPGQVPLAVSSLLPFSGVL